MTDNKGHSPIGASGASRWFECPGSVELIKHSPPQESSSYAHQGTAAHTVLEECFQTDKYPGEYEGMEYEGGELDTEDIEAVEDAIHWLDDKVLTVRRKYGEVVVLKEVGFDLSNLHKDLWGTADIVIYTPCFSFLGVYDYKHGSGTYVAVEGNVQLKYYTLGAINHVGSHGIDLFGWGSVFSYMEMGIIQPRCENIEVVELSAAEIDLFALVLWDMAKTTTLPDAPFAAGSHCRWCAAKPLCPQLYNKTAQLAKQDFKTVKTLDLPSHDRLTTNEIAKILDFAPAITSWLSSLNGYAQRELEKGKEVPGYKLVKRKANRKWTDESKVEDLYHTWYTSIDMDLYNQKLKSPTQLEKILEDSKKKELQKYITKPDNGNTIAPETDRRKAVIPTAITDFEIIKSEG